MSCSRSSEGEERLPLIVLPDGRVLVDPTDAEIAFATGAAVDPRSTATTTW